MNKIIKILYGISNVALCNQIDKCKNSIQNKKIFTRNFCQFTIKQKNIFLLK